MAHVDHLHSNNRFDANPLSSIRKFKWYEVVKHVSLANVAVGVGPVREVRLGEVRLGEACLGEVRLGEVRLGEVRLGEVRLGEACLGEACLGEACLGEACR